MKTKILKPSESAYSYPLLIKRLLTSTQRMEENNQIVSGSHRFSYRQLNERICRLANALRAQGVAPGDHLVELAAQDSLGNRGVAVRGDSALVLRALRQHLAEIRLGLRQFGTQRGDHRVVALRIAILAGTIDRRTGDEGIGTGTGDFGDIVHLHAAIALRRLPRPRLAGHGQRRQGAGTGSPEERRSGRSPQGL